tara:strand:- start:33 stop:302 length:270 start_codon:yes stop_codon:yes gene_type:complete
LEEIHIGSKMIDDEKMDKLIKKASADPEWKETYEAFMKWSQTASMIGWTVEEMASVCMMGYAIGQDTDLQDMIKNMAAISKLGLDIIDN